MPSSATSCYTSEPTQTKTHIFTQYWCGSTQLTPKIKSEINHSSRQADGKWLVYRECGQLFTQQVRAAVKAHGAGVCAGRWGSWRAAAGGKVEEGEVPGLNCEGADRHREVGFNIMTSHTQTTSVLSWTNDKSRFKAKMYVCLQYPAGIDCSVYSWRQKTLFMIHFERYIL